MHIEMKHIFKSFSSVQVLKDTSFSLAEGEIHALMGENGAGKSTLMKVLTGVYSKDSGEITVDGSPIAYKHPKEAEAAGIVFIYQELNSMQDLSVEENMFMCKEIHGPFGSLNKKAMLEKAKNTIEELGVQINPREIMKNLSLGQQQMVEIAKALMIDAKTIIMDEPTAALSPSETKVLFRVVRRLKAQGVSFVYISHRMEEIFELCDRITILRDGQYIATKNIANTNMTEVVRMMIGRDIGERFPERHAKIQDEVFRVESLSKEGLFENISFSVKQGEVLGVAGLMGAGRTEIMQAIFGYRPYDSGKIFMKSQEIKIRSPEEAKKHKIGFITEDRKTEGLLLEESIERNIAINNLDLISDYTIVIRHKKEQRLVQSAIEKLSIRCFGPQQKCLELSGGNQQKVVFAKWIYNSPALLILDEPSRGVDVGAKKEIYAIINELAEQGVGIILISSELPEVLGMSDRIMAIYEGQISGFIERSEATQENVMTLCTGGTLS